MSLLLWILIGCLCVVTTAHAQETNPAAPGPVVEAESQTPVSQAKLFVSDREYDRVIRGLAPAIQDRNWTLVCERLLQFQVASPEDLGTYQGVVASVPLIAARILETLPDEGMKTYQRLAQPVAGEKLRTAIRNSDISAIIQVARHYRRTPAAEDALTLLIQHQIDLGEWEEAALVMAGHHGRSPQSVVSKFVADQKELQRRLQSERLPPDYLKNEFPSLVAAWEHLPDLHEQTRESLETTYRELRQNGLAPYPSFSLTPITGGVVLCGPGQRTALNLSTGQQLWQRAIPGYMSQWMQDPGDLGDGFRRRMFRISVARRVFDESVTSRTSHGGHWLYFVEPIALDDPVAKLVPTFEEPFPASRIVCVQAATGKTEWVFNGLPQGEIFFCGPPALFGDRVYVLGQTEMAGTLKLFTLDATTGQSLQTLELSSPQAGQSVKDAPSRQAARIEIDGGQLICATASGAILSIDPFFGEINWAIQLPLVKDQLPQTDRREMQMKSTGFEDWTGWQEIQLLNAGELLIFVTPGSDVLTALNQKTGQLVWQIPRGGAVHVASADRQSLVVLIEKAGARAVDLKTGRTRWASSIPEPAGRGALIGNGYVFPILERDYARLNLGNGQVDYSCHSDLRTPVADGVLSRKILPRHLISQSGALFEFSTNGIRRLQSSGQAAALINSHSNSDNLLVQIEREDWRSILPKLEAFLKLPAGKEHSLVRETLRSLLTVAVRKESVPAEQHRLRGHLDQLSATPVERAAWRQIQALDRLQARDWPAFVTLWLDCPLAELEVLLPGFQEDFRCRLDRWFQAVIDQQFQQFSPDEAATFKKQVDDRLPDIASLDHAEQQRWLQILGTTEWGKRWVLALPMESPDLPDRVQRQLHWLRLSEDADPVIAALAVERLLRDDVNRSQWLDAARWLSKLFEFPSDLALSAERTPAIIIQELAPIVQQGQANDKSLQPWPDRVPSMQVRPGKTSEVQLLPVSVQAARGSFMTHLNVEMDFPAHQAVRFNGSRWSRPWYQTFPRTDRNLRLSVGLDHAWGFEQFLVVQTGSEVFGISPLNQKNSRSSRQIWPPKSTSIDTLGTRDNLILSSTWTPAIQRPGIEGPPGRQIDEFGHYAAAVGPVRSGYLCLQQMGMLVTLETSTGKELWRRYDLPQEAFVCGDESQIAVIAPRLQRITRYRVLDGKEIGHQPWSEPMSSLVHQSGLKLLLIQGDRFGWGMMPDVSDTVPETSPAQEEEAAPQADVPVELKLVDAGTNAVLWKREWPAKSLPFKIDSRLFGMLQPGGQVEFLEIDTGKTLKSLQLDLPQQPARIACSVSEQDFLIVFSTFDKTAAVPVEIRPQLGYRHPMVSGLTCCFHRDTGELIWQQDLPECVLRLDQPVDLPIFITMAAPAPPRLEPEEPSEMPPAEQETPGPPEEKEAETPREEVPEEMEPETEPGAELTPPGICLRCYDRRTGKLLHELTGERNLYSVTGNRERQLITLDTIKTRLEIDFSQPVTEPVR